MKQPWSKPELIVLVERLSDEIIILACKTGSGGQPDTRSGSNHCNYQGTSTNCS